MEDMLEKARQAASKICGKVSRARHVEALPTGEQVFRVGVVGRDHEATVTLNPNGLRAGVEWRDQYRVFKVCGTVERS